MPYTDTVLITGGTSGLGYQTALIVARQHPEYLIVIASRNDTNSASKTINSTLKQENTLFLPLDLSSLPNIRSFAKSWASKNFPPIIALLLNAALQFPTGHQKTESGIEATFGITHVGNSLLFFLMRPYLANSARIVITSSGTHDPAQKTGLSDAVYNSAAELAFPKVTSGNIDGRQRYASAKLANVLFTYALHRRLEKEGKGRTVVAMDPGLMPGTGLAREAGNVLQWISNSVAPKAIGLLRVLLSPNIHTPAESGAALADLATGEEVKGLSGVYFEGRKEIKSSVDSYKVEKQEDLWKWTVKNVAIDEVEARRFESFD